MSISLLDLVDIGLNVDLSGLRSVLEQFRGRVDSLQDRVADLENDGNVVDEDRVRELVESALDNADFLTESNAYDAVSSQVYDMVKDVVREDLDEHDWATSDHDHDGIYATTDSVDELEVRVQGLEEQGVANTSDRVDDLERRLDLYAQKVDAAIRDAHTLRMKVESLENASQDAVTLLGLLRRAAEIILGR